MSFVFSRIAVCGVVSIFAQSAFATDLPNRTNAPSIPLSLMNYSGGNDWARYEISPNWSRELGWSLTGAFGSYITNDLAMGAIVEYGQDKREYLTNAGFRLSEKLTFIGTVGMLEEHRKFVLDAGKETVQQMEYGASLKGAYEFGLFRGFELNGYLADANAKSDNIETGKLYGTQILTNVDLTDSTRLKIGGGYEWLRWDEGEENNAFSFRADGVQKLTNKLSAVANVKLGASEYVYGGGLAYNLGDRANSNVIGINYEHIEGKNGIQSDKRVQVSWTMGMGVGPKALSSGNVSTSNSKSNSLNLNQSNAPANTLLADVMKRPEFLPKRVLARAKSGGEACPFVVVDNVNRDTENLKFNTEGDGTAIQVYLLGPLDGTFPSPSDVSFNNITANSYNSGEGTFGSQTVYAYFFTSPTNLTGVNGLSFEISGYPACRFSLDYSTY